MAWYRRLTGALVVVVLYVMPTVAGENPKMSMAWWQANYTALTPQEDVRVERAQAIFHRLRHAAGTRSGVEPRLYIIKDTLNGPLAIAIADGGIILSKGALDICYRDPQRGDDRLAFVLAHELAHQLKDDFWHVRFFEALTAAQGTIPGDAARLEEIRAIARSTDQVQAKELQADTEGIIYASMAGFNTLAIVNTDAAVNFFADWVQALDPQRLSGTPHDPSHPTPEQRATAVQTRLREVLAHVEVFRLGLQFYQAGAYPQAIHAFERFVRAYPSREAYHNLATSYHQLAVKYYRAWKGDELALPFQVSLAIDPVTRASMIILKGGDTPPEVLVKEHIAKAIEFYDRAIQLDPTYVLAYNNRGCASLLTDEAEQAIATLRQALKHAHTSGETQNNVETQNNLGVAYWYNQQPDKAREWLTQAYAGDPTAPAPLFNLGKLAHVTGQAEEAEGYWRAYMQQDPTSPWAAAIRQARGWPAPTPLSEPSVAPPRETLLGVKVGTYTNKLPQSWGRPTQTKIPLAKALFVVAVYPQGLLSVSQDEEIVMLATLEGYSAPSARGITPGRAASQVLAAYGHPSHLIPMAQGVSWVYDGPRIAFTLRAERVVSWLLF